MNRILRCGATAILAVGFLAGFAAVRGSWVTDLGLDLWSIEESLDTLQAQQVRGQLLAVRAREILDRYHAKKAIARDLVEGRKTLPEAMSCMRGLCDAYPESWEWLRMAERGGSDKERIAEHVLGWIEVAFPDDPARAEAEVARLREALHRQAKQQHCI